MPSLILTSLFLIDRSNQRARLYITGRSTFMLWSDLVTRGCLIIANDPISVLYYRNTFDPYRKLLLGFKRRLGSYYLALLFSD
jgi:hypothetical protein